MANVAYTSTQPVNTQARYVLACSLLADLLQHLPAFGVQLVSIVVNADLTVTVTLSGPIRADHLDGGLVGAPCSRWGLGAGV